MTMTFRTYRIRTALTAFCVPAMLALAACGGSDEPEVTTGDDVPVDVPEIPLETFENARGDEAMGVDPTADEVDGATDGPMTGEVSPGDDQAIDPATTGDPTVTEGM